MSKVTEHGEYAYGYDDLYRLASADNPIQDDEAFTYGPVGNRLTSADTTGLWTYNDNNELNAHNDTAYEYDDNGNMTKKTDGGVVTNFIYNVEDRLIEVRDGSDSLIASYYYDQFGRRLWKEVGGVRTYFLYADEGLIGEYDGTGGEIKSYGYAPGATWTTDPLFMKEGNAYYFYHNDHLGTPQKMTGVNGGVVWSATYSSFGEANVEVQTVKNNLRFPGQYYDNETGLHYNYFRFYDSKLGRYLREDPIGLEGGVNFYVFVFENPINFIDPSGLRGGYRPPPVFRPQPDIPESGRRAPGGASSGCHDTLMTFCDEWCCDWDECTQKCKAKCPIIKSPSTKTITKCIKSHTEWVTICNGILIRYN